MNDIKSQRLARAIESAWPRDVTDFIDYIARDFDRGNKYLLHRRALEWAKTHFNDATPSSEAV